MNSRSKKRGKYYEHRREWIETQILSLADIFAIDVAAYAVMSNHLHLVLRIDIELANSWSDREVIEQWHRCFNGTGHFWEGRFKSQALLDEAAVLACMSYVELNPIRAKMVDTLEDSDHTSIQLRVNAALKGEQPTKLLPFIGDERLNQPKGISFALKDYLALVDETGRIIRDDKRGSISSHCEKILTRLNISSDHWIKLTSEFGQLFHSPVGETQAVTHYCEHLKIRRRHFSKSCQHFQVD